MIHDVSFRVMPTADQPDLEQGTKTFEVDMPPAAARVLRDRLVRLQNTGYISNVQVTLREPTDTGAEAIHELLDLIDPPVKVVDLGPNPTPKDVRRAREGR